MGPPSSLITIPILIARYRQDRRVENGRIDVIHRVIPGVVNG